MPMNQTLSKRRSELLLSGCQAAGITEVGRVLQPIPVFPYNMIVRFCYFVIVLFGLSLAGVAVAQDSPPVEQLPTDKSSPPPKDNAKAPPRSDNVPAGESSSTQTRIDVAPPSNDLKAHPEAGLDPDADVNEFTPYNPMKAMKAIEVGDWYLKQGNTRAALSRYREALDYKPHDAEATFKLAEVLNKTGDLAGATENYEDYLKILPNGPHAKKSKEALEKLKTKTAKE
jgi:tetratricopeptide (TPR) repeat protein